MSFFSKIILFSFNFQMIYALSCMYVSPEEQVKDAKSLYLFKVVEIADSYEDSKDPIVYALKRDIEVEVIKIYKGDIEKLSKIKTLHTIKPCDPNNATGGPGRFCNKDDKLSYPLKKGDIRFSANIDGYFYLDSMCPGVSDLKIESDANLKSLEERSNLKAIWTRAGFKLD